VSSRYTSAESEKESSVARKIKQPASEKRSESGIADREKTSTSMVTGIAARDVKVRGAGAGVVSLDDLSARLNKVADDAVRRDLGGEALTDSSSVAVKVKRQEAVITELLSMLLEGGVAGPEKGSSNHPSQARVPGNNTPDRDRSVTAAIAPEGRYPPSSDERKEEISFDDVLFLLREQQQELEEIRQITQKGRGGGTRLFSPESSSERYLAASDYYGAVHHPSSPLDYHHHSPEERYVFTSIHSSLSLCLPCN
jgi:hypothetical protein